MRYVRTNRFEDVIAITAVVGTILLFWAYAPVNTQRVVDNGDEYKSFIFPHSIEVETVANWTVSGAGTTGYNGVYVESGTKNGQPYYKLDDNHYLFYAENEMSSYIWVLSAALTDNWEAWAYHAYTPEAPLPCEPWAATTGSNPPPDLTEGGSVYSWPEYYEDTDITLPVYPYDDISIYTPSSGHGGDARVNWYFLYKYIMPQAVEFAGYYIIPTTADYTMVPVHISTGVTNFKIGVFSLAEYEAWDNATDIPEGNVELDVDIDWEDLPPEGFEHVDEYSGYIEAFGPVVHLTPYLEADKAAVIVGRAEVEVGGVLNYEQQYIFFTYKANPDPPTDPDQGTSDLLVSDVTLHNGEYLNVIATDDEVTVSCAITENGSDVLDYVKLYLYKNGVFEQTTTYYDADPGQFSNTFRGLTLAEGDILKCVVYAYDTNGDYYAAVGSTGVGEFRNKRMVIGDAAADYSGWSLTDVSIVDTDDLQISQIATLYKLTGTMRLVYDSGYDATVWDMLSFSANLPEDTLISFKVRTASTEVGLTSATYYPVSGITESGYSLAENEDIDPNRWIDILCTLSTTDNTVTPSLYSLEIFYSAAAGTTSTKKWDTDAELGEATLTNTVVDDGELKLTGTTDYDYESDGYFILRVDAGAFVNFDTIDWDATVPEDTTLSYQFKAYSDPATVSDVAWSDPVTAKGAIDFSGVYLDIKVSMATADAGVSPEITSVTVGFTQTVEPAVNYVYTTKFEFTETVASIFVTDVQNEQDPACFVEYRYAVNDDTEWRDMLPLGRDSFVKVLTTEYLSGEKLRIVAKLVSCSTETKAKLDEFAALFALENGKMVQIL